MNGTLRTLYLAPVIGDFPARRVGVFVAIAIIFVITLAFTRWMGARTGPSCWASALLWVVLTVMFEFALGRAVFHYDWSRILSDYDLSRGGLMVFGLLAMVFTPLLAARIRGRSSRL